MLLRYNNGNECVSVFAFYCFYKIAVSKGHLINHAVYT